jgi:hypothetical protein
MARVIGYACPNTIFRIPISIITRKIPETRIIRTTSTYFKTTIRDKVLRVSYGISEHKKQEYNKLV